MPIAQMLLPEFDHELANARKVIERVPPDRLDFKPHERSWSMIELSTHLARLLNWAGATMSMSEMDLSGHQREPALESVDAVLELFDRNTAEARAAIAAASDEQFMAPWTLKSGDEVYFTMPRAAVVRSFVLNHLIHHRGQLTVYLRMAGAKVPGMYGPSADESM